MTLWWQLQSNSIVYAILTIVALYITKITLLLFIKKIEDVYICRKLLIIENVILKRSERNIYLDRFFFIILFNMRLCFTSYSLSLMHIIKYKEENWCFGCLFQMSATGRKRLYWNSQWLPAPNALVYHHGVMFLHSIQIAYWLHLLMNQVSHQLVLQFSSSCIKFERSSTTRVIWYSQLEEIDNQIWGE